MAATTHIQFPGSWDFTDDKDPCHISTRLEGHIASLDVSNVPFDMSDLSDIVNPVFQSALNQNLSLGMVHITMKGESSQSIIIDYLTESFKEANERRLSAQAPDGQYNTQNSSP